MGSSLIYYGNATLEDLYALHDEWGFEFIIEDGAVTQIVTN